MKKMIGITLSLIGIIMVAISLVLKVKSLSVIGGADGPTSIFIAGKVGDASAITGIVVGIVLLAIGIFVFVRKK